MPSLRDQDFKRGIELGLAIDYLPRLSLEEEMRIIKVFHKGKLQPYTPWLYFDPPVFPNIEIAGMPGTSKTPLLAAYDQHLTEHAIQHSLYREKSLARTPTRIASEADFGLLYFFEAAKALMKIEHEGKGPALLDGSVFKAMAFMRAWNGNAGDNNRFDLFAHEYLGGYVDALVILNSTAQTCLERGSAQDPTYLERLSQEFRQLPKHILEVREKMGVELQPLILAEFEADMPVQFYQDNLFRTISSILHICYLRNPTRYRG